jgi:hypothetical protein
MRKLLIVLAGVATLAACATQPAPTAAPAAVAKAPQCWNGDAGKFQDLGTKATISGVAVTCEKTTDGKNAQWMGGKKH